MPQKVNHLLYTDDLKLDAKNEKALTSLVGTVRIFTTDRPICLAFGLEKYAGKIQHGNIKATYGLNRDMEKIKDGNIETDYHHLVYYLNMQNKRKKVLSKIKTTYRRRLQGRF